MKSGKYLFFLAIVVTAISCSKSNSTNPINISTKVMLNVAYGSDMKQVMDIYLPAGRDTSTKVLVLIHGGSWTGGDKNDFAQYIDTFQTRLPGYAIFNINYRLAATSLPFKNAFPTQEQDIETATLFIYNNEKSYFVSNNWCLLGFSAGGHLALLQGYKNNSVIKPKVVVDLFGPTDMTDLYNFYSNNSTTQYGFSYLLNGIPSKNPSLYNSSSPINYVTSTSPPTLILHGGKDTIVPFRESVNLHNKLTSVGVINKYVFYPNQLHGFKGIDELDSHEQMVSFIKTYMP